LVDVAYKRFLNKFNENKEKEAKKKRKEEEEKLKNQQAKQNQQPVIREITAEEAERIKNEQNKSNEMLVDSESKKDEPVVESIPEEKKEGEEDDPKKPKEGHVMPGPGNGNKFDNYAWTQLLIHEINVTIPVDSSVKGKDIKIDYDAKHLKVQIKGQDKPVIDGELCKPMNVSHF
jgi:hypothetical protein